MHWYQVQNVANIDSPALLLFPDRIEHNIKAMVAIVNGDPSRLMPHVKTHKTREVIAMQLQAGIRRFKCATIAELEMCLAAGAPEILLAYQLNPPKIQRFLKLAQLFPQAGISSLVDNLASARQLAAASREAGITARVYIDINNGQNRTGFPIQEDLLSLFREIAGFPHLEVLGLHVYDGHVRGGPVESRKAASDQAFAPVWEWVRKLQTAGIEVREIISGGSPSFIPSSLRAGVFCSPGTTLLWDWNYADTMTDLDFSMGSRRTKPGNFETCSRSNHHRSWSQVGQRGEPPAPKGEVSQSPPGATCRSK